MFNERSISGITEHSSLIIIKSIAFNYSRTKEKTTTKRRRSFVFAFECRRTLVERITVVRCDIINSDLVSIFIYFISQLEFFVVLFLLSWNEHLFALYWFLSFRYHRNSRKVHQALGWFPVVPLRATVFLSIHILLQFEN